MTWRVRVEPDFAANGIAITVGEKTNNGLLVVRPIILNYEFAPPAVQVEPSLRISDEMAKVLLEALTVHYGGVSDVRTLREDYMHERERVDKFINHFLRGTE